MKNKTLAFFGIGTYILSIFALIEDLEGNYNAPIVLVIISAIATIIFTIMAVIRLWKYYKITSILLAITTAISLIYIMPLIKGLNTIVFIWAICLLWAMAKQERIINMPKQERL